MAALAALLLCALMFWTDPAQADAFGPTQVTATFDGWHSQQDRIAVSWSSVVGADGYNVFYEKAGFQYAVARVDSSTTSYSFDKPLTAGQITVGVTATGPFGSGTTTTPLDIPGPQLTANPVNAAPGQVDVGVVSAFAGDSLDVRISPYGTSPTTGTPVQLDNSGNARLTGLVPNTTYVVLVSEIRPDAADDVSPSVQVDVRTVPNAETGLQLNDRQRDGKPTSFFVDWAVPPGCDPMRAFMNCDLDWVLLKSGTSPSTDPNDGERVSSGSVGNSATNQSGAVLNDIAIGSTYTVTVFRTGDLVHWGPPISATFTNKMTPQGHLAASPSGGAQLGQPVTLTGTITNPYVTPTGTVAFETIDANGTNVLCPPRPLPDSGLVTCQTTTTAIARASGSGAGKRSIYLDYSGDQNVRGRRGWSISYDVTKALPAVAARHSAKPSVRGRITFAATVSGVAGTPTGAVKMKSGDVVICRNVRVVSGRASCSIPGRVLGVGSRTVTVTYSGDGRYRARSKKLTFTVRH